MINMHTRIIQTACHLWKIFSAHLHKKWICLYHINLLHRIIFRKFSYNTAVSSADYKYLFHLRMHCHRHMTDHLMIDKLVFFGEHQISVYNKNFAKLFRLKHIDSLYLTLSRKHLIIHSNCQFYIVRMFIMEPHLHRLHLPVISARSDTLSGHLPVRS